MSINLKQERKMTFKSIIGAVCTCLAIVSTSAYAVPAYVISGNTITGVTGLDVGGDTWDMTLHEGSFDDLFTAQPASALYTEAFSLAASTSLMDFSNSISLPATEMLG